MREATLAVAVSALLLSSGGAWSQMEPIELSSATPQSPQIKSQLERGYRLRNQKKNIEAIAAFQKVLQADPGNHAALVEIGYLQAGMKHWDNAVKYLGEASAQDPSNMRLHMDLGYAQQARQDVEAARGEFEIVARDQGEFQSQAQAALQALKSAGSSVSPADAKQRRLLEQGYAALKRKDRAGARVKFEAAVQNDPKDVAALKELGFLNLGEGKLGAAAGNFEAVRAVDPNDYYVALQLGYIYARLRKRDQAEQAFGAALASTDAKIHDAAQAALKPAAGGGAPSPSR